MQMDATDANDIEKQNELSLNPSHENSRDALEPTNNPDKQAEQTVEAAAVVLSKLKSESTDSVSASSDAITAPMSAAPAVATNPVKKIKEAKPKKPQLTRLDLERLYKLPESPHIIVHPSRTAKNNKFECKLVSLSHLLGYHKEDNKESSFEVSLFAEYFNEMLIRDNGFVIFKHLISVKEDNTSSSSSSSSSTSSYKRKLSVSNETSNAASSGAAESKLG